MTDVSECATDKTESNTSICTAFSRSPKMRTHDSLVIGEALPVPSTSSLELSSPTAFLFTSESVGEGQSDKLCDQVRAR